MVAELLGYRVEPVPITALPNGWAPSGKLTPFSSSVNGVDDNDSTHVIGLL